MNRSELRFQLLKLVWPTGPDARNAEPAHYQAKVSELETWILEAGHPATDPDTPPKRPRGRPRKIRDPEQPVLDTSI